MTRIYEFDDAFKAMTGELVDWRAAAARYILNTPNNPLSFAALKEKVENTPRANLSPQERLFQAATQDVQRVTANFYQIATESGFSSTQATSIANFALDRLLTQGKRHLTTNDIRIGTKTLATLVAERTQQAEAAQEKEDQEQRTRDLDALGDVTKLVLGGALINVAKSSPKHEAARVQIAQFLESKVEWNDAAKKSLGIADGDSLDLVDDSGKITNRPLLVRALKLYQSHRGLVSDGRVGPATLQRILNFGVLNYQEEDTRGSYTINTVIQGIGHLCGRSNSCEGITYDAPPGDETVRVGAVRNLISLLDKIDNSAATQVVSATLTQTEIDRLKYLASKLEMSDGVSKEEIEAFQSTFGLKVDGIVASETARALAQVETRMALGQAIDPSEIRAAVIGNAPRRGSRSQG